jgi:hypothetical protein
MKNPWKNQSNSSTYKTHIDLLQNLTLKHKNPTNPREEKEREREMPISIDDVDGFGGERFFVDCARHSVCLA